MRSGHRLEARQGTFEVSAHRLLGVVGPTSGDLPHDLAVLRQRLRPDAALEVQPEHVQVHVGARQRVTEHGVARQPCDLVVEAGVVAVIARSASVTFCDAATSTAATSARSRARSSRVASSAARPAAHGSSRSRNSYKRRQFGVRQERVVL